MRQSSKMRICVTAGQLCLQTVDVIKLKKTLKNMKSSPETVLEEILGPPSRNSLAWDSGAEE